MRQVLSERDGVICAVAAGIDSVGGGGILYHHQPCSLTIWRSILRAARGQSET